MKFETLVPEKAHSDESCNLLVLDNSEEVKHLPFTQRKRSFMSIEYLESNYIKPNKFVSFNDL